MVSTPIVTRADVDSARLDLSPSARRAEQSELKHQSELGLSLSGGNSDAQSIQIKQRTQYSWGANLARLGGHFLAQFANGAPSAQNWNFEPRYERAFTPRFSALAGGGADGDRFAGYEYRAHVDSGAKYYLLGSVDSRDYVFNETGYRYTRERRVPMAELAFRTSHQARVYFEGQRALSQTVAANLAVELLPEPVTNQDFQANLEPSVKVMLSKHFALKLDLKAKYDREPALVGGKRWDYYYTTALVGDY